MKKSALLCALLYSATSHAINTIKELCFFFCCYFPSQESRQDIYIQLEQPVTRVQNNSHQDLRKKHETLRKELLNLSEKTHESSSHDKGPDNEPDSSFKIMHADNNPHDSTYEGSDDEDLSFLIQASFTPSQSGIVQQDVELVDTKELLQKQKITEEEKILFKINNKKVPTLFDVKMCMKYPALLGKACTIIPYLIYDPLVYDNLKNLFSNRKPSAVVLHDPQPIRKYDLSPCRKPTIHIKKAHHFLISCACMKLYKAKTGNGQLGTDCALHILQYLGPIELNENTKFLTKKPH